MEEGKKLTGVIGVVVGVIRSHAGLACDVALVVSVRAK